MFGVNPVFVFGTAMATLFQHDYHTCMISVGKKEICLMEEKRVLTLNKSIVIFRENWCFLKELSTFRVRLFFMFNA